MKIPMIILNRFRSVIAAKVEFESAMIQIRAVSDLSEDEYKDMAKDFKKEATECASTAIDFANQKYDKLIRGKK
jgi:hypothetical protein